MFKSIIAAAVIATATFTTTASAMTVSQCLAVGEMLEKLAIARDSGVSLYNAFNIMTDNGVSEEIVLVLVELVYIDGKDFSGSATKAMFIGSCVGESA